MPATASRTCVRSQQHRLWSLQRRLRPRQQHTYVLAQGLSGANNARSIVVGTDGSDTITGGASNNAVAGSANDILIGGGGNDTITDAGGAASNNLMIGGTGDDTLSSSGAASDSNNIYVFSPGDGTDTISDAGGSTDRISSSGGDGLHDPAVLRRQHRPQAGALVIQYDGGQITLGNHYVPGTARPQGISLDGGSFAGYNFGTDNYLDSRPIRSGAPQRSTSSALVAGEDGATNIVTDTLGDNNVFFGGGLGDTLNGGGGADLLVGGGGADTLNGGESDRRRLLGGAGNDTSTAGRGPTPPPSRATPPTTTSPSTSPPAAPSSPSPTFAAGSPDGTDTVSNVENCGSRTGPRVFRSSAAWRRQG